MSRRTATKTLALANFVVGAGLLVWFSCSERVVEPAPAAGSAQPQQGPVDPPAFGPAVEAVPADDPTLLRTLAAIVACLEDAGGVVGGRCVKPATVRGVELGDSLNNEYFSASKAAVFVTTRTPAEMVESLAAQCSGGGQLGVGLAPQPRRAAASDGRNNARVPQAQAAPAVQGDAVEPHDADTVACVLGEVERRTNQP